jgi:hypothetical protein
VTSSRSSRFDVQQHDDGQIYVTEDGAQMLHALIKGQHEVEVQIGAGGTVTIDKLYGPMVFWDLRITCDLDTCEWVIGRSMGPTGEFKEWCRIPGQLEEDFSDHG